MEYGHRKPTTHFARVNIVAHSFLLGNARQKSHTEDEHIRQKQERKSLGVFAELKRQVTLL